MLRKIGKKAPTYPRELTTLLKNYTYPGNIRELENIIEHALIVCRGKMIEVCIDGSEDTQVFSNGLADDLITSFSRVPGLLVSSRGDAFTLAPNSASQKVRERLRVAHYLEGSVQIAGDKLRIIVQLIDSAVAGGHESKFSPVKARARDFYTPNSEDLRPDEMRLIACGTGMPTARPKQAASCWLLELGNGDKFIFDVGTGSNDEVDVPGFPSKEFAATRAAARSSVSACWSSRPPPRSRPSVSALDQHSAIGRASRAFGLDQVLGRAPQRR